MDAIRISSKLQTKEQTEHIPGPSPNILTSVENDGISPAAKRQRAYRERLKQRPDYQRIAQNGAKRSKEYRQSLNEDQKKEAREKARIRQLKRREKKRLQGVNLSANRKPATGSAVDEKHTKDRIRQQKYRAGLSTQKKTAIKLNRKQKRDKAKAEAVLRRVEQENIAAHNSTPRKNGEGLYEGAGTSGDPFILNKATPTVADIDNMENQDNQVLKRMKIEIDIAEDLPEQDWYSTQEVHPHVSFSTEESAAIKMGCTPETSTDHDRPSIQSRQMRRKQPASIACSEAGQEESENSEERMQNGCTKEQAASSIVKGAWVKQEVLTDIPSVWMGQAVQTAAMPSTQHDVSVKLETVLIRQTEQRLHACEHCDAVFSRHGNLKAHMLVHTAQRPHTCLQCDAAFRYPDSLKRHMIKHTVHHRPSSRLNKNLLTHTGQRTHACLHCNTAFTQSSSLQAHMLIHTAPRRYACQHCDAAFRAAGSLKKHIRVHTEEKPYVCQYCKTAFRTSNCLKSHMQKHPTPSQ